MGSRLLDLPAELRNDIYRLVVLTPEPLSLAGDDKVLEPSALCVSKQVRKEALSIFCMENTFLLRCRATSEYDDNAEVLEQLHKVPLEKLKVIKHLRIECKLCSAVGACIKGLQVWKDMDLPLETVDFDDLAGNYAGILMQDLEQAGMKLKKIHLVVDHHWDRQTVDECSDFYTTWFYVLPALGILHTPIGEFASLWTRAVQKRLDEKEKRSPRILTPI